MSANKSARLFLSLAVLVTVFMSFLGVYASLRPTKVDAKANVVSVVRYDIPTRAPVHGEPMPSTGIVSITCRLRDHFQYHNEDKGYCGEGVSAVTAEATKKADEPKVVVTETPVISTPVPTNTPEPAPTLVVNTPTQEPTEAPTQAPADDGCDKSNPGNDKCKGKEDNEHCDQGMCEQGDEGNKGNGNKPDKSGVGVVGVALVALYIKMRPGYFKRAYVGPDYREFFWTDAVRDYAMELAFDELCALRDAGHDEEGIYTKSLINAGMQYHTEVVS